MDIFKSLNNGNNGLSEEERAFADKFNSDLRERIIYELVEYEIKEFVRCLKEDSEIFKENIIIFIGLSNVKKCLCLRC